jgi:hypothetical protein
MGQNVPACENHLIAPDAHMGLASTTERSVTRSTWYVERIHQSKIYKARLVDPHFVPDPFPDHV